MVCIFRLKVETRCRNTSLREARARKWLGSGRRLVCVLLPRLPTDRASQTGGFLRGFPAPQNHQGELVCQNLLVSTLHGAFLLLSGASAAREGHHLGKQRLATLAGDRPQHPGRCLSRKCAEKQRESGRGGCLKYEPHMLLQGLQSLMAYQGCAGGGAGASSLFQAFSGMGSRPMEVVS